MGNILTYVQTNLNTFDIEPFNEIDSLVLSQLSYIKLNKLKGLFGARGNIKVPLRKLLMLEHMHDYFNIVSEKDDKQLLFLLAASPRFRDIKLAYHVDKFDELSEKQFSATTIFLDRKTIYIAYRGTDTTFIGWKEDFNMSFMGCVPAQQEARIYLNSVHKKHPYAKFYIGGHSKGGNLALYSAVNADSSLQDKILNIYSHDGPGFLEDITKSSRYANISNKVKKTVPHSSIIGMLMQTHDNISIVDSEGLLLMQHNPYNWKIDNSNFVTVAELSETAQLTNRTIEQWLNSMDFNKREKFITALFDILEQVQVNTLDDFASNWKTELKNIYVATKNMDADTKKFLNEVIRNFTTTGVKMLFTFDNMK